MGARWLLSDVGALRKDTGNGGSELLPSARWSEKSPPMQIIFDGRAIGGNTVTESSLQYPFSLCLPSSKCFFAEPAATCAFDSALESLRNSRIGSEEDFAPVISATCFASIITPILLSPAFR